MKNENGFYADVGEWECGKHIKLDATTLEDAIKEASGRVDEAGQWVNPDDAMVVEIYYNGNIVWDYMNGKIGDCPNS